TFTGKQEAARASFEKMLGVRIDVNGLLSSSYTYMILIGFTLGVSILIFLLARFSRKAALARV
ncbi:MAG: ABC transporter permease, partial [Lacticaseibacillus paracasei]